MVLICRISVSLLMPPPLLLECINVRCTSQVKQSQVVQSHTVQSRGFKLGHIVQFGYASQVVLSYTVVRVYFRMSRDVLFSQGVLIRMCRVTLCRQGVLSQVVQSYTVQIGCVVRLCGVTLCCQGVLECVEIRCVWGV